MHWVFILTLCCLSSCKSSPSPQEPKIEVTAFKVEPKTIPATFEYVGVAQSSHPVEIRARVEGYLEKIGYKEGELVHENDLLFKLDPRPFIAAVDNAKGLLDRYKAELWNAKQAVARYKPLYEQKAASKRDLDNAIAAELAAQANVNSAQAQLVEAKLNLSYTTIRSPITGLASKSNFREGALIMPAGPSGLLTTISVVDPIWVYFNVSEGDILKYQDEITKKLLEFPKDLNFDVQLILSDGSTFSSTGKVNFADPSFQQSTGTLLIRAEFDNPHLDVRPGQFVRAEVLGATRPNAIFVPQQSVQQGQKGMYVYLVDKDGRAKMQEVSLGDWFKNYWIILSGLNPGDQIIVDGVNKIQPGAKISIKKELRYIDTK